MKKKLSLKEAVHAGHIVYSLNTDTHAVLRLATRFSCIDLMIKHTHIRVNTESKLDQFLTTPEERFLWEWRAFVHAAVMHGLSKYAPAIVMVEYVRTVQDILKSQYENCNDIMIQMFIDEPFHQYVQVVLEEKNQDCPAIFFKRLFGIDIKESDFFKDKSEESYTHCLAGISSTMAMLFAASEDAFEKFDYALE